MKKIVYTILAVATLWIPLATYAQVQPEQVVVENRKNAKKQKKKPYVILVSADGFRHDYIEKHQAKFLASMAEQGVRSSALIPSFPTVTFPNHYSIVTGLYPSHHGLVGNNMYDPKVKGERYSLGNAAAVRDPAWYGGTPIWSLAEQNNLLSACFYWPGSEAPIQGYLPTYYYPYSERIEIDKRVTELVNWLSLPEDQRPHLIAFYFPEVDKMGHKYGPDAPETYEAVQYVDASMRKIVDAVAKTGLEVNFVFVADHGMTQVDVEKPLAIPVKIDPATTQVVNGGSYVSLFVKDAQKKLELFNEISALQDPRYEVFLKEEVPAKYHFNARDDRFGRIGDLVLIAKAPNYFSNNTPPVGAHGYDPYEFPEMNAVMLAWGPLFKKGKTIGAVENIHVFPLLAHMLKLDIKEAVDGDKRLVKKMLK